MSDALPYGTADDADPRLIAYLIGMQACIAALARSVLLRHGSEAFVQAEEEAIQFARHAAEISGEYGQQIAERAEALVRDLFGKADAA